MTDQLYKDFDNAGLIPLWNLREELMPSTPNPKAVPYIWHWDELYPLAARAGELVPVGRGGERRAIAVSNPGLPGLPYATPTLWAAIQYLGPNEVAPAHRHSQNAFRFVVEGEGVWTVVDGDPVAMRRGDLLLTPGWCFHGHHNPNPQPMAWLDGLDIPFVHYTDSGFFEFGEDDVDDRSTPERSRSERLWGHPGLRPLTAPSRSPAGRVPLAAHRRRTARISSPWAEGTWVEPDHAAVRFINPATGADALSTMRMEMHRVVGHQHGAEARGRIQRLAGLRRHRRHHPRRRPHRATARRPDRGPVLVLLVHRAATSTCSGSATRRSSNDSTSTEEQQHETGHHPHPRHDRRGTHRRRRRARTRPHRRRASC